MQENTTDKFDDFLAIDMDLKFHEFVNHEEYSLNLDTSFLKEWKNK